MSRRKSFEAVVAFVPAPITDCGRGTDPPDPEAVERSRALGTLTLYVLGTEPLELDGKRVRLTIIG